VIPGGGRENGGGEALIFPVPRERGVGIWEGAGGLRRPHTNTRTV